MKPPGSAATAVREPLGRGAYAMPILAGLLVAAAGLVPFIVLAQVNARVRPDLPWAAVATLAYLAGLVAWLGGLGPPTRTALERRRRLRLWPRSTPDVAEGPALAVGPVVTMLGMLYILWILLSRLSPIPGLSGFPTTSYRWSMFLMGGLTAGLVEEVAFRGYMQTGLERIDPRNAIWITSAVFVAVHITQGLGAVLVMGPGLFIASMLYGMLAQRTGTILPGIAIHIVGDLARVYFGVMRADGSLLFVK